MLLNLKNELSLINHISTMTDCWSIFKKLVSILNILIAHIILNTKFVYTIINNKLFIIFKNCMLTNYIKSLLFKNLFIFYLVIILYT